MVYIYRTTTGTFSIEADEQCEGMFKLCIGGMWLATFEKVEEAVQCVQCRQTGWYDWDKRALSESAPCDLGEWECV